MNHTALFSRPAVLLGFLALLSACATAPDSPPPPSPPPMSVAQSLDLEIDLGASYFEQHEFESAIGVLVPLSARLENSLTQQVRIHKLLAFSYCAMQRRDLCRQQFDAALLADPTFQLTQAERGHPIWDPEFQKARKAAERKPAVRPRGTTQ